MMHVEKLRVQLTSGRGARIGETAVVSKKVHTLYPEHPEKVHIITNSDAGRTFYHRQREDEIIHIDLFHEIATCDVNRLGKYIKASMGGSSFKEMMDYIDLQTGGGGGRLTGALNYGLEEKLVQDHKNHVHLTGLIPLEMLDAVFFLVEKSEEGLQDQGIELRKIEKIIHEKGNAPMDMSPYSTNSDSKLKSQQPDTDKDERIHREAVNAIDHFGGLREIEDLLEAMHQGKPSSNLSNLKKKVSDAEDIIKYFEQTKHIERKQHQLRLTEDGENLYDYIKLYHRELESILKKSIRNLPRLKNYWGLDMISTGKAETRAARGHQVLDLKDPLEWIEELDICETVKRALTRGHFEKQGFYLAEEDLVSVKRIPKIDQDVCLLIDASASMAGYRLRNAKYLAKHLVLRTHRRVSVLAFKEKEVKAYVPFTKNFEMLEKGLNNIGATGLTPLALALDKGLDYMCSKPLKNPLMILITDGIPTISHWTSDPVKDAVKAASKISKKSIDFCCIGLQPNKECLVEVVQSAKGKLFVVEELNREVLVDVTRKSGQLLG